MELQEELISLMHQHLSKSTAMNPVQMLCVHTLIAVLQSTQPHFVSMKQ
jgi:hypothetical protein